MESLASQVADGALHARDYDGFVHEAAELIGRSVGADGVLIQHVTEPVNPCGVWQVDIDLVTRAGALMPALRHSMPRLNRALLVGACGLRHVYTSLEIERLPLYTDFHRPSRIGADITCFAGSHALVALRSGTRQFERAGFDGIRPVLELALRSLMGKALPDLTNRQREIALLVARGLTNRQIASCLGISANTVRNVLVETFARAGAESRSELAAIVARENLRATREPAKKRT